MLSRICKLISSPRSIGQSIFATLAVVGALVAFTTSGGLLEQTDFVAGPLDDTWDYLVELWNLMFG